MLGISGQLWEIEAHAVLLAGVGEGGGEGGCGGEGGAGRYRCAPPILTSATRSPQVQGSHSGSWGGG